MTPWLLLLGTMVCAFVTYDAFRLGGALKDAPFNVISDMWKGGLSHLSQVDKNKIQERYAHSVFGLFQIKFLFLLATLAMAVATVRAFIA
jgi:hypothetical protein